MSLMDHLEELRKRILWAIVSLAVTFGPCWYYREQLVDFLSQPIHGAARPQARLPRRDGPVHPLFQGGGARRDSSWPRRSSSSSSGSSWPRACTGKRRCTPSRSSFRPRFSFSAAARSATTWRSPGREFLLEMGEQFQPVITIERYFGFLITVILGLGLMFEMPVVVLLLCMIGIVSPGFLLRKWRSRWSSSSSWRPSSRRLPTS